MADQKISQLSSYTPPIDTDVIPIVDITTSITKKITWANIKAALKTYFDSLTTTLTNKTLTTPVINTSISGTAIATSEEVLAGTDNTQIVTPLAMASVGRASGDNLLLNPEFQVGATANLPLYWELQITPTLALAADTLFPALGGNQITITSVGANMEGIEILGSATNWLKAKPSTTYTFSFDYKVTAADTLRVYCQSFNEATPGTVHATSEFTSITPVRTSFTFTTDADATNLRLDLEAKTDGDIVIVSHPKLEEGSIATPFEPCYARTRLASKLITATRDMAAASGDVAYTGLDFTPTSIQAIASISTTFSFSIGFADSLKFAGAVAAGDANTNQPSDQLIMLWIDATKRQYASIKTFNNNGFTLTWVKESTPTGTATLRFLCFR